MLDNKPRQVSGVIHAVRDKHADDNFRYQIMLNSNTTWQIPTTGVEPEDLEALAKELRNNRASKGINNHPFASLLEIKGYILYKEQVVFRITNQKNMEHEAALSRRADLRAEGKNLHLVVSVFPHITEDVFHLRGWNTEKDDIALQSSLITFRNILTTLNSMSQKRQDEPDKASSCNIEYGEILEEGVTPFSLTYSCVPL